MGFEGKRFLFSPPPTPYTFFFFFASALTFIGVIALVHFFCTCIRLITEYACPVFHDSPPVYLSNELEGVQKRAMRIIFAFSPYNESLVESSLIKLSDRRQELVGKIFKTP